MLLLPEKENKIFKVSKCEGNCIKGLVANTEPFRLREIQINFLIVVIKWMPASKLTFKLEDM